MSDLSEKIKVLYIAGWGRSGSTILGRILGQVEGFTWVGELRYILSRGIMENRVCSCGNPFDKCPFWSKVTERVLNGESRREVEKLIELRELGPRVRHIAFSPRLGTVRENMSRMGEYRDVLQEFYAASREESGADVLVDTSKYPSDAYILESMPGIEVYLLHLVRDPRAVAYSWKSRKKLRQDNLGRPGIEMTRHGTVKSSLFWSEWNFAAERAFKDAPHRYFLLRYEDFIEAPRSSVESVLDFIGEGDRETPFTDPRSVTLEVPHAFSGNPDRFSNGPSVIESSEEWRSRVGYLQKAAVLSLTWPGLLRYKYPPWS